ncbi:hypothetical protein CORC01_03517 [Colletotrichum orchidophilum]|uniref:DoxX family protein n=1 Tax=Colletotrichum orchidophilum TaxID=1209926 RepID=A0A1G4BIE3_9PEZI|nr:uncharacterized protein CORC01_03517 [Colletotrichum orchidophilum]OHF01202.1 hypothetical protein CORC01_03517 [Colletotrichum orchidophilum]
MASILLAIPRILLAFEYFVGGIPRLGPWPFKTLHERIYRKSQITAPYLQPLYPFTGQRTIKLHMQYIGALMVTEGFLLALPQTRGGIFALVLGCFLTASGYWSQMRADMPYWLPVTNFGLAWVVWYIENRS